MSDSAELSAVLEAALVRELRRLYEQLNERRFADKLKPPVLALSARTKRLGQWTRATRVLELSSTGPRVYGGNYDEYVASTGREAPGMRVQA